MSVTNPQLDVGLDVFSGATAGQIPVWDAVLGHPVPRNGTFVDITRPPYNAIGDGTLHPLSERFATLVAAQAVYPAAAALTDSIDGAALQLAFNNASSIFGATIFAPRGIYVFNQTPGNDTSNITLAGEGMGSTVFRLAAGASAGTLRNVIRFNTSLSGTPPRLSNITCRDFTVDAQGGTQTWAAGGITGALTFYACDNLLGERVQSINGRDFCINADGCGRQRFLNCYIDTCYAQGASNPLNVDSTGTVQGSDAVIIGCEVKHTTTVAIASAAAAGTTATYTTSANHNLSTNQWLKITGSSVAAYNGFYLITVTGPTTFTATIATSNPGASTGGTALLAADKNIYLGGQNFTRLIVTNNISATALGTISAEVASPGASDYTVSNNIVYDFQDHGIGISDHSTPTATNFFSRAVCANNIVRGSVGTSTFGTASTGSFRGILANGTYVTCIANQISNVRRGIETGTNLAYDEVFIAVTENQISLATDANAGGILVTKNPGTSNTLRYLQVRGNQVDGQGSTTSTYGLWVIGNVNDFDIANNQLRGMGKSGIYLQTAGGIGPSRGGIHNNRLIDNNANSAGNALLQDQVGIAIGPNTGSLSDSIVLTRNKAYDTRGTKLQAYGLYVASGATNIRSEDDDFTGNLTGEINDATNGAGLYHKDYRDPTGQGYASTGLGPWNQAAAGIAANTIVYMRVRQGGTVGATKLKLRINAVDSTTPGTTDQIWGAVYANTGVGDAAQPGAAKIISPARTATTGFFSLLLGGTVNVQVGDWIAIGVASAATTFIGVTSSDGNQNYDTAASSTATPPLPVTSPAVTRGTSARLPDVKATP